MFVREPKNGVVICKDCKRILGFLSPKHKHCGIHFVIGNPHGYMFCHYRFLHTGSITLGRGKEVTHDYENDFALTGDWEQAHKNYGLYRKTVQQL